MKCFKILALAFVASLVTACFDSKDSEGTSSDHSSTSDSSKAAPSDSPSGEKMSFPEALKIKRSLAKELSKLEEELEAAKNPSTEQATALKSLQEIEQYRESLSEAQSAISESLEFWRRETRKSFEGVQLPEVFTSSGTLYRAVTITGVGDEELAITHEGGTATIPIAELTPALRKNLIHEPTVLTEIQ